MDILNVKLAEISQSTGIENHILLLSCQKDQKILDLYKNVKEIQLQDIKKEVKDELITIDHINKLNITAFNQVMKYITKMANKEIEL